jgi:hypothetical protein
MISSLLELLRVKTAFTLFKCALIVGGVAVAILGLCDVFESGDLNAPLSLTVLF